MLSGSQEVIISPTRPEGVSLLVDIPYEAIVASSFRAHV
jgi:hypothetical protein